MKNALFLSLLFALAFMQVSAQKTLPPSLKSYAVNWTYSVVKSMHAAGFDMPTMPAANVKTPVAQLRNNPLQLDSTKTFYGYDFPGGPDSLPFQRTVYTYPSVNTKIELNSQFENGQWQYISETTFTYDGQKRILLALAQAYDPLTETFRNDSRLEALPHGDSPDLLDQFIVSSWDTISHTWIQLLAVSNTFDDQDRLKESLSTVSYFGDPVLFRDVYIYDVNGDNVVIESYAIFEGEQFPTGKQEMTYQNHLVTESITDAYDEFGQVGVRDRLSYSYTSFNKTAALNGYYWDFGVADWHQTEHTEFDYDNEQRLSVKTSTYIYEDHEELERYAYEYVENEDLAVESYLTAVTGSDFFLRQRKFFFYSEGVASSPEPSKILPLTVSPNPTTGFAQLSLAETALVRIYNTQGDIISSGEYSPQSTFNFTELPSGVYFITALSASEMRSGRVVKE